MTERFNFYDIYGYLLPGVLLLVLLWLPFGLLFSQWPPVGWASAILALGLAYLVGHLLHALSEAAFPSKFKHGNQKWHPSYLLIDRNGETALSSRYRLGNLKYRLAAQIEHQFGVRIDVDGPPAKDLNARRSEAFFKCRTLLLHKKALAYAEQQQGMYALLRGTAAGCVIACALYLGLGFGCMFNHWRVPYPAVHCLFILLVLGIIAAILGLDPSREERARRNLFWILAGILMYVGVSVASIIDVPTPDCLTVLANLEVNLQKEIDPVKYLERERALSCVHRTNQIRENRTILMFALAVATMIFSPVCISAFRAFATSFARTVYHDFSALVPSPSVEDVRTRAYQIYEREGRPAGKATGHWLQAEEELRAS